MYYMITILKGILQSPRDWKHQYLCFLCPHCNKIHCLYVSKDGKKSSDGLNIWGYRMVDSNRVEVNPSYDNSKYCGFHSTNPWQVELVSSIEWEKIVGF